MPMFSNIQLPLRVPSFVARLSITAALVASATFAVAQSVPNDAKSLCSVAPATFATWFKTGVATVNGEVLPANSITFPNVPNCSFYDWSEQMFLWLLSPTPSKYGGGGSHIFNSPIFFDVSPPDAMGMRKFIAHTIGRPRFFPVRNAQLGVHNLPVIFDRRGQMFEVVQAPVSETGRSQVLNRGGKLVEVERVNADKAGTVTLFDRAGKVIDVDHKIAPRREVLRGIDMFEGDTKLEPQAKLVAAPQTQVMSKIPLSNKIVRSITIGSTKKIIFIGPNGNVIDTGQGQAGGGEVLMAQNGSLVYYSTTVNDVYAYFRSSFAGAIPANTKFPTTQAQLNPIIAFAATKGKTFPDPEALAIEVKSAWVEASSLANPQDFITVTSTVPTYDMSNPNQWLPNGSKTVKLAMVGMHVVGSAKGHPEMIWATFEHFGNTPNAAYSYKNAANVTINVPQSTAGAWLFAANNAVAPFNVSHMFFSNPNIVSNVPNTISASNTIRWKAWGTASNTANAANANSEVISNTASVINQLLVGDIRKNYRMTGATWTIGGAAPNGVNEVGTHHLTNSTLETYDQGTSNMANGTNCFSCHGSNSVSVSHVFAATKPLP